MHGGHRIGFLLPPLRRTLTADNVTHSTLADSKKN
jgi:hypothetical protein